MKFLKRISLELAISIALHVVAFVILGGIILFEIPVSEDRMKSAGIFEDEPFQPVQEQELLLEEPTLEEEMSLELARDLEQDLVVSEGPELDSLQAVLDAPIIGQESISILSADGVTSASALSGGISGLGNSASGHLGKTGQKVNDLASKISFFGVEDSGNKVVIAFDVSKSVLNKAEDVGVTTERMKEEAVKVLQGLSRDHEFGLVQFVRNYKQFGKSLVKASVRNVRDAEMWIEKEFVSSGSMPAGGKGVIKMEPNGIESVLRQTFSWQPDMIYLISDGSFYKGVGMQKVAYGDIERLVADLQKGRDQKVRIHFIGFEMRENERKSLRKIVSRTGGSLVEMTAGD